jgi:integrase
MLPVPANQKMNGYLKEVADLSGINKNLTTHCARHTFGTTVTLANKISMESVSKMLGHSSLAMTKKYARILDTSIGQEMTLLVEKTVRLTVEKFMIRTAYLKGFQLRYQHQTV